jgi:hypothetical protein
MRSGWPSTWLAYDLTRNDVGIAIVPLLVPKTGTSCPLPKKVTNYIAVAKMPSG